MLVDGRTAMLLTWLLELDAGLALAHFADDERPHALVLQSTLHAVGVEGADDDDKADAHVEDPEHLRLVDVTQFLQPAEHGWHRPRALLDEHAPTRRQDAGHVSFESFAGDVGQAPEDAP